MSSINNNIMAARNAILSQNSALQQVAKADKIAPGTAAGGNGPAGDITAFSGKLSEALGEVNKMQQASADAATAYEMGQTTDIAAVMMAKQKASIGFEATLQVRNKLLAAYNDIMNMPV